jgi:predicted O-methyltransferase YrrM
LARATAARTVVEVGSGGGYSGLWFMGGMEPKGILTTIEVDSSHQTLAQQAYAEAGVTGRVRSLLGPALQMLPKLADASYDIVFVDALKSEYPDYLEHAKRLLRPGGVLVADNVLWGGRVADPLIDDADTEGLRMFNDAVTEDPDFSGLILPIGDGILVAVLKA